MDQPPLRVVLFGIGVVGSGVLRLAQTRPELKIVGAVVRQSKWHGRPARELVDVAPDDLLLSTDGAAVLSSTRPDVVVIATRSTLGDVLPQLRLAAQAGAAIACTAEELAYIARSDGPEAAEIFDLAEGHHIPIVAVGINPGFVLDVWPLALASIAHDITSIEAERAVDLSGFGPNVRLSLGVGYWPEEFQRELARGTIAGHRGFRESLRLLGEALGRPVDETHVETKPILALSPRPLVGGEIVAGQTAGVRQRAIGRTKGIEWLRLSMTASVSLAEIGVEPSDRVHIAGANELTAVIKPGTRAVPSTVGRIVNALPAIASATPGVHSAFALGLTPARSSGSVENVAHLVRRPNVVGSWRLVSARASGDGLESDTPFGSSPKGILSYDREGRMTALITHSGRKPLSSDYVASPTDEKAEAFATSLAYAGRYSLLAEVVTHHVEVSSVENWVNTDIVRLIRLEGDRLILRTPPMSIGAKIQIVELIWERIK